MDKILSRAKLQSVIQQCILVLIEEGIDLRMDRSYPFTQAFLSEIDFFIKVEAGAKNETEANYREMLGEDKINKIAIKFALVFAKNDLGKMYYVECLNAIRAIVLNCLKLLGYDIQDMWASGYWGCYKLWEDVARAGNCTEEEIKDFRDHCKKRFETMYEA